jgi:predicted nucleic acid-binding protein
MNAYFETSAIVKLLVLEDGSDVADGLWDESDLLVTSRIAYAEVRAAVASAHRAHRISIEELAKAKKTLDARFRVIDLLEVTDVIVRRAGDLAEDHALKGFDAIHLASAMTMESGGVTLVSWDTDLARAGHRVGLDVAGAHMA